MGRTWVRGIAAGGLVCVCLTSWAAAPVARIDDDGMMVVAGRRTFVFGCYHNPHTDEGLRNLRQAGFNLVSSLPSRESLDQIEKQGLFGWVPLGGLLAPANQAQEEKLVATVRSLADHRALIAWEIPDEALWTVWYGRYGRLEQENVRLSKLLQDRTKAGVNVTEARKLIDRKKEAWQRADFATAEQLDRQVRQLLGALGQNPDIQVSHAPAAADRLLQRLLRGYRLVHEADGRPVWMNYAPRNTPEDLRRFAAAADIVGCDIYPVPTVPVTRHGDLATQGLCTVGDYTDRFQRAGEGRPVWMVLQGFGWRDLQSKPSTAPPEVGRRPTRRETRLMLYDAMVHGARGVLYFGTNRASDPPKFLQDLDSVVHEASAQASLWSARDAATQPKVSYAPTYSSVDRIPRALAKQDGSRLGLLVVNEHSRGLEVHVTSLAATDGARVAILGDADGCALGSDRVTKGNLTVFMPGESALVLTIGEK